MLEVVNMIAGVERLQMIYKPNGCSYVLQLTCMRWVDHDTGLVVKGRVLAVVCAADCLSAFGNNCEL